MRRTTLFCTIETVWVPDSLAKRAVTMLLAPWPCEITAIGLPSALTTHDTFLATGASWSAVDSTILTRFTAGLTMP